MNLAILHYHLNRGGVTRVIENQLAALDSVVEPSTRWRAAVIGGGRRDGWDERLPGQLHSIDLSVVDAPLMDYDDQRTDCGTGDPDALHRQVREILDRLGFSPENTVVHWHNHSLGKNRSVPGAVERTAADGFAVLLQIHDFAEDYRAKNYQAIGEPGGLYPQAGHIHYAVLNGRDRRILGEAGVPDERLHFLPNPVPRLDRLPARKQARQKLDERFGVGGYQRLVLYPVRCIRRKNIGEALLYAAMAPPDTVIGLTLAPLNPAERVYYDKWTQLAGRLRLPCRFELGGPDGLGFTENLAASDLILTTSVAEGFGMVFLESWLAGRPLVGRDLPEITGDFRQAEVRLDGLHPRVDVPLEWLGAETVRRQIAEGYRRTLTAYGRQVPKEFDVRLDAKLAGGTIDFGDLDEELQAAAIQGVRDDLTKRSRLAELNPQIAAGLSLRREEMAEPIEANRKAIERGFSRTPSGRRLLGVYEQLAGSHRHQAPQPVARPERILDGFLGVDRFRLLRS